MKLEITEKERAFLEGICQNAEILIHLGNPFPEIDLDEITNLKNKLRQLAKKESFKNCPSKG